MAKQVQVQEANRRQEGLRRFLLRGIENVRAEWALICTAHDLTKLARTA
jgi:hypothetical protein